MNGRRILSWLLMICLLSASLPVLAEGTDSSSAARAEAALQIDVEYDEENAEWDGKLQAQVRVSWSSPDGPVCAEDVRLWLETSDGLSLSKGEYELELGDIENGSAVVFGMELTYDSSYEKADYVPEPTLKITAVGSNTGYTVYTCRLDGTTEPRALVLGWELSDVGPRAVQTDVSLMEGIFSESYYNKRQFEVVPSFNEGTFESFISMAEPWEEDANDVTYIYINAHGAANNGVGLPAFCADTDKDSVWIDGQEYTGGGIVTYENMLSYLNEQYKGRVVIITEICYSGQIIKVAADLGLDSDKFTILTATTGAMPSILWPDEFDLNDMDGSGMLLGWADLPEVSAPFSYGWFTNDLCDLLDAGYAEDENGVVTVRSAYSYLSDAGAALKMRFESALKNNNKKEDISLENISGLDDVIDAVDIWSERMMEVKEFAGYSVFSILNKMDPLDAIQQLFVSMMEYVNPVFAGNDDTLLYCSDPEYDDGKRLLTVVEETAESMTALEMYYAYLNDWVVPEIGLARRDDLITGERRFDAEYWADLLYYQSVSGLLSATVCDLDKNGSLDMLTLTITPREAALIEATGLYFSVSMDMYQIEEGRVVCSDSREDILFINDENQGIWSHMRCWMVDYNGQINFRSSCYSSAGNSDEWTHFFSCTFKEGKIVDGAEAIYLKDHVIQTEEGLAYSYSDWGYGYYNHMGDGVAFIEVFGNRWEDIYNAFDYTGLYEYIYGYAEPEVYVPLKLVAVPVQALPSAEQTAINRKAEVKAGIETAVNAAMSAVGKEAYSYSVSCSVDTGEAVQVIIYSNLDDFSAVDTEKMRSMALAVLESPDVAASEDAISIMQNFEFSKKSQVEKETDGYRMTFMMIPDGTYALILNLDE